MIKIIFKKWIIKFWNRELLYNHPVYMIIIWIMISNNVVKKYNSKIKTKLLKLIIYLYNLF